MPKVTLQQNEIQKRGKQFTKLLGCLLKTKSSMLAWGTQPLSSDFGEHYKTGIVIAAHDGNTHKLQSYRDWRFSIFVPNYNASYFEVWLPVDNRTQDIWYLQQAYLTIFKATKEYVALHCDPEEPENDTRAKYKISPHIHIKAAEPPIPKSHIAIASGYYKQIYAEQKIFDSMRIGIELIKDEILSRIE